jgi:hypothetical protein
VSSEDKPDDAPRARTVHVQVGAHAARAASSLVSSELAKSFKPITAVLSRASKAMAVHVPRPRLLPPDVADSLKRLADTLRESVPPNWRDLADPDYEAALRIMNGGIPLIWVPRSSIVERLMQTEDALAREEILSLARQDIASDCLTVLAEITIEDLQPLTRLAAQAAVALRGEYSAPAQALAANVLDTWLRAAVRRGILFKPVSERFRFYENVRRQITLVSMDLEIVKLKPSGALAPVFLALEHFDSQINPRPEHFGRHATAHAAYPEQYTAANAVIAVMLMTSVLRQADASGW